MTSLESTKGAIVIEGHVQGLSNTRSLGEAGVPIIVVDTNDCVARHSRYCKAFFKCPPFSSDDFAGFLIKLAKTRELTDWLLLPSNDHAVWTIARNKTQLELHYKVITPGPEIVENIYDKSRLLKIAHIAGVPFPTTWYATSSDMESIDLSFPVITRGRFGLDFYKATGRKAFLANNIEELQDQFKFIGKRMLLQKTMTQELIPDSGTNNTISFTAFCVDGDIKAYWMGEKVREHPLSFGTATYAKSVFVKACHSLSVRLLKSLNYTGICEIEYLKDPRDSLFKLIEINARTWLWVGLAKACGVDFARLAYAYVNGMTMSFPKEYKTGINWINPFTDAVYAVKAMLIGKLNVLTYLRSILFDKKINALFDIKDMKPGFAYLLNIFSYMRQR